MAIVIPSKHIYDKDNNKIRDNKIDRVEVNATEITPDNEYETPVYNGDILFLENESKIESVENKSDIGLKSDEQGGEFPGTYYAVVLLDNKNTYLEGTIEIPKLKDNHYVNRVYYEQNGRNDIGVSIYSTKTSQTASISYVIPKYENGQPNHYFSKKSFGENISQETQSGLIDLPFVVEESSEGAYAKVESLPNTTNLVLDYKEKEKSYSIKYKILSIVEISYFKGKGYRSWLEELIIPCSGEKVKYEATKIEFTIYGNTIGIDLNDKTVYIPDESGNKPFSVEGNELMQTSNYYTLKQVDDKDLISPTSYWVGKSDYNNYAYYTSVHIDGEKNSWETYVDYKDAKDGVIKTVIIPPRQNTHSPALETTGKDTIEIIKVYNKNSICSQFQDTLLEYSNGKETATILCDIYNYVDAVKFKVLEYELLEDGSVYCRLKTDNINDIYDISNIGYIYVNGVEGFVQDIDEEEFLLIVYFNDESIIEYLQKNEITINNNSNFYFNIGDVVIPMVYGANGADKPLSKYKDGTPKKFKVLGTRIFYDGAVWQELTLQETLE